MQVLNGKQVVSTTSSHLSEVYDLKKHGNVGRPTYQAKSPQVVREQDNRVGICAPTFSLSLSWMLEKAKPAIPSNKPTILLTQIIHCGVPDK